MLTTGAHKHHSLSLKLYLLRLELNMYLFLTRPVPTILQSNHTPRFSPFVSPSFYVLPLALSVWNAKCPDVPSEWFIRQDFLKTPRRDVYPAVTEEEEFLLIKNQRRSGV